MIAAANRNHVGVGEDVLLEELWIARVRAESRGSVVQNTRNTYLRDSGNSYIDVLIVLGITHSRFVQYPRREGMDPAELTSWIQIAGRIGEAPGAGGIAGPEAVCLFVQINLCKQSVRRFRIKVDSQRTFVPVKEVAIT